MQRTRDRAAYQTLYALRLQPCDILGRGAPFQFVQAFAADLLPPRLDDQDVPGRVKNRRDTGSVNGVCCFHALNICNPRAKWHRLGYIDVTICPAISYDIIGGEA